MFNYSSNALGFQINWDIKKEPVYRILDNLEWMENFFEKGEILISCFDIFKNYPDEMRGDSDEGKGIFGGEDENGDHNFVLYDGGLNAYIMSATMNLTEAVKKDFKGKCAIKINNPTMFGMEIAKKLPFANSGLEGKCVYGNSRVQIMSREAKENLLFQKIDFENDPQSSQLLNNLTTGVELFAKDKRYKHQEEYRLIWFSHFEVRSSIVINCPEAVQYCQKEYF